MYKSPKLPKSKIESAIKQNKELSRERAYALSILKRIFNDYKAGGDLDSLLRSNMAAINNELRYYAGNIKSLRSQLSDNDE